MLDPSVYPDTFARDGLPPFDLWPAFEGLDALDYPKRFNAAVELLDRAVAAGFGQRLAIRTLAATWTYEELLDKANRIAAVLVNDLGLVPGNRVLLRSANNAMKAACWLVTSCFWAVSTSIRVLRILSSSSTIASVSMPLASPLIVGMGRGVRS